MKNLKVYSFGIERVYKVNPIQSINKDIYHKSKYQKNDFQGLLEREKNKTKKGRKR